MLIVMLQPYRIPYFTTIAESVLIRAGQGGFPEPLTPEQQHQVRFSSRVPPSRRNVVSALLGLQTLSGRTEEQQTHIQRNLNLLVCKFSALAGFWDWCGCCDAEDRR